MMSLSKISTAAKHRIVYYGLGGGLGHLTRARAIIGALKKAARQHLQIILLTNSPFGQLMINEVDELISIPSEDCLETALARALAIEPALFIVDTFPRGLMGELAGWLARLQRPRVLIQRYLNERYVKKFEIANFVARHFDRALRLGDNLPRQNFTAATTDLPAVTILDQLPCAPPQQIFNINSDAPRILMIDFGAAADAYIKAIPPGFQKRIVTPHPQRLAAMPDAVCHYPAAAIFHQADLVIGSCGYNLYHEIDQTNMPAIFLPQKKLYDDQFLRARGTMQATSPQELAAMLENWHIGALREKASRPTRVHCQSGAQLAAQAILAMLDG
jgi:predicted glycosyltransferase